MSSLASALLALAASASPAAQDQELLTLYVADAQQCFTDPKDAALVEALRMIDDRVLELPGEIPGFPALPPDVVRLAAHLLTGEKTLRIGATSDPNQMLPVYVQLELNEGDAERAQRVAQTLAGLAAMGGVTLGPPREADGLQPLQLPAPVEVVFGAHQGDVLLSVGPTQHQPLDLSGSGLPAGVRPSCALHADVGGILDIALQFAQMGAPQEAAQIERFVDLLGLSELVLDAATGSDQERSYSVMRMPGYAGTLGEMGLMPTRALAARDLALVPGDAAWAFVGTTNWEGTLRLMLALLEEPLAEQGMGDPLEMVAAMTGIDLRADLVAHLGPVYGAYTSDTTGGGGLLSAVLFFELANRDGLRDTLVRMQAMANGLAASEARGYVRVRDWEAGGTSYFTLTFPGLPVPFEPTLALTNHHLLVGLTPQAATAAVAQAASGEGGLARHPRLQANLPAPVEGAYSVEFFDAPRFLREGYGLTSLLCSAVVNGTRSRTDDTRDAGLVMPPYHGLAEGALATVGVTRVVGDDFVSEYRGDRSLLVNVAAGIGAFSSSPAAALLPLAVIGAVTSRIEAEQQAAMWAEMEELPDEAWEEEDDDGR